LTSYKELNAIPKDIEQLLKGGAKVSPEELSNLSEAVAKAAASYLNPRDETFKLRMSSIGYPERQLWFKANKKEAATPLGLDRLLTFMVGSIMEEVILWLLEKTGKYRVTDRQETVTVDGVVGHTDCRINGIGVDVKTAGKGSFDKFVTRSIKDNDPYGYLPQIAGYFKEDKNDGVGFLVFGKDNGELVFSGFSKEELPDAREKIKKAKEVISLSEPPKEKCYPLKEQKNGNNVVPNNCVWCQFFKECYKGEAIRAFSYASGPTYLAGEVKSEPKVREVDPWTLRPLEQDTTEIETREVEFKHV
jgi:hypothetical protein